MGNKISEIIAKMSGKYGFDSPNSEEEPYILTEQEEKSAMENALISLKKYVAWRFMDKGFKENDISDKMAKEDWQSHLNREEILLKANAVKQQVLWHQEQRKKEKEAELKRQEELKKRWTADYFFRFMIWTSENVFKKPFIQHDENKLSINAICLFLSNDKRFETELGYSFSKGLLFRGVSGRGKSFLIECVAKNRLKPIKILSTIEITDDIKNYGEYQLVMGSNKILYLDDIGREPKRVLHYGSEYFFFQQFIELNYLKKVDFSKIIISTNNNLAELGAMYGYPVRSRISDMFNIIDVTGPDLRNPEPLVLTG